MAFAHVTRSGEWGIRHQVGSLVGRLSEQYRRYRVYRQTIGELNALNDRDLADLGIHRSAIPSIALDAAYGR